MTMTLLKQHKSFSGSTRFYEHDSQLTKTKMKLSAIIPKGGDTNIENCIIWLSGLTCNEENFVTKAGAQKYLAKTNTMLVCPDTSPRGLNLPREHEDYDFGSGAGFYVNATTDSYKNNYLMYDYICKELINLLTKAFSIQQFSIMGHSMGGHGALILGLREQATFQSVSAFSPITNPMQCSWGQKAFQGYLGDDRAQWKNYDATELLLSGHNRTDKLFIDQGLADEFLQSQLATQNFENIAKQAGQNLIVKYREDYDHSYYYIASFIEEHINFHLNSFCS